jgi:hypothetical protein
VPGSSFSGLSLSGAGPAAGLVFEDEGIEEVFGGFLLVAAELADGFELELELLVGAALVHIEDRRPVGPRSVPGRGEAGVDATDRAPRRTATYRPSARIARKALLRMAPPSDRSRPALPEPLAGLITEHVAALEAKHYAASTVRSRRRDLLHFARWCGVRGLEAPCELTLPVLERYRHTLFHTRKANGQPLGWGAQTQKLLAVKQLLRWATRMHVIGCDVGAALELPRRPQHLPRGVLSVSEVERVLAAPDLADPMGLRDRAILETLYSTGMRRQELINLALPTSSGASCTSAKARGRRIAWCRSASGRSTGSSAIATRCGPSTWWSRIRARSSSRVAGNRSPPIGSRSSCTATSRRRVSGRPAAAISFATRWRR